MPRSATMNSDNFFDDDGFEDEFDFASVLDYDDGLPPVDDGTIDFADYDENTGQHVDPYVIVIPDDDEENMEVETETDEWMRKVERKLVAQLGMMLCYLKLYILLISLVCCLDQKTI